MLYQKFLSIGRFKQEEYRLHRAICNQSQLSTASLAQILFFIQQFEFLFITREMMHIVAAKGVLSYHGIELLSLSEYTSMLCSAICCQCDGICNDLMQLKQYQLFLPNSHSFQVVISDALRLKNISVFESLMKHPAFAALYARDLQDYLQQVTWNAKHEGEAGEWKRILALLITMIENRSLL